MIRGIGVLALAAAIVGVCAGAFAVPAAARSGHRGHTRRHRRAPVNTKRPYITGRAISGDTLRAHVGKWTGSPTRYRYQWRSCKARRCTNVRRANRATLHLSGAEVGRQLLVVVVASNPHGSASGTSRRTATVRRKSKQKVSSPPPPPPPPPVETAPPTISGGAVVGGSLFANPGSWTNSPTRYEYQWELCTSSSACIDIGGATSNTFLPILGDLGDGLVVEVTASNAGGSASAKSARTSAVAPALYVAQNASGADSGDSCADAHSAAWFDSPADWGGGKSQIGTGGVVFLCGTISSPLTAFGSGTSTAPITIDWASGAALAEPYCPTGNNQGCFNTNGQSYLTLNGGSNGVIEATANGSGLANQQAGNGLNATGCNGCTIENLTIQNIYRHTSMSDNSGGAQSASGLVVTGSDFVVANNTIDNAGLGIYDDPGPADTNDQIHGNNIYNTNWSIALIRQQSGGTIGPIYIYSNHLHDWGNWNTSDDDYHHNGLHCFSGGDASTPPHYTGLYFYDNRLDGTSGTSDATALAWIEPASLGAPCGDATSNFYVFNNVFDPSDGTPGNGELAPQDGNVRVYNNTLIGPSRNNGIGLYLDYGGTVDIRNNLIDNLGTLVQDVNPSRVTLSPAPDYDFFANSGSNAFVCNGTYGFPSGLSRWQACSGGDSHGTADTSFSLNSDGSLLAGSRALGAGENLHSICNGQPNPGLGALCENINGTPRPSTGPWATGAF